MAFYDFDATSVEPNAGFDVIPAGSYAAVIVNDEMRDTKNGKGRYLQLEFEIIDGEFKGRKLWSRLNLENPNPEVVRIARGDLSSICRAVNVLKLTDTLELHNLPLIIDVKCKKDPEGEIRNEIKAYKPRAAYAPNASSAAPAPQTQKAPWAK